MRRILLADPARDYRSGMMQAMAPEDRLECCGDGQAALELLRRYAPEVFVLDMRLSDVDGTWVLRRAAEAGILPTTIVTGYYFSVSLMSLLERYGVAAIVYKAYTPSNLLELADDLLDTTSSQELCQISAHDWISNTLVGLSVVTSQSGFRYLRDAIELLVVDFSSQMTKNVYPTVAKRYHLTTAAVEKAMRTSIQTAYRRGNPEQWKRFFPTDPNGEVAQPTTSFFLSRLADCCPVKPVS